MRLIDVNILVYAFRADLPEHRAYHTWLESLVNEHLQRIPPHRDERSHIPRAVAARRGH